MDNPIHIEDRKEACCLEALELLKAGGIAGDISLLLAARHDLTSQESREQIGIAESILDKFLAL